MTADWIHNNATISGPHALFPGYFEIIVTSSTTHHRAISVNLISPGVLSATDSYTVALTIAMDPAVANATRDHDPVFGISDGKAFIGSLTADVGNYGSSPPCFGFEGQSSSGELGDRRSLNHGSLVTSRQFSGEIRVQFRPKERWASCTTGHDAGYVNTANYQRILDPSNGLFFEFYRGNSVDETYRIKYIVVDIDLD